MHTNYSDITNRIEEPVKWWDEYAVPRYCDFEPNKVADIYCEEVALVLISCQACGTRFKVAFSGSKTNVWLSMVRSQKYYDLKTEEERLAYLGTVPDWPLATDIQDLHYGDPPNTDCCSAGATMNCMDIKVLEYWRNDHSKGWEWVRMPEFEIILPDHPEYGI